MRRRTAVLVLALLGLAALATIPGRLAPERAQDRGHAVADTLADLPLSFEPNRGQAGAGIDYVARGPGFRLSLAAGQAAIALPGSALTVRLVDADPGARATPGDPLPTRTNYLVGDDPAGWVTDVPSFGRVTYDDVYPGVDLVFFGNQRRLEHDFVVAPGADPGAIAFVIDGDRQVFLDPNGDLAITAPPGGTDARLAQPVLYQDVAGTRRPVEGSFVLRDGNKVGFAVGPYDARLPLVIDPVLVTSTYLGGSGLDAAAAVDVDAAGNVYVAGSTESTDFPTTTPLQPAANTDGSAGKSDAFVAKYNPEGNTMLFATYLGGTARDAASGVAVGGDGSVYVTGVTESPDFPKTTPVAQEAFGGGPSDAFVVKLSPAGTALAYSTFLGGTGTDAARGIAVASSGEAVVTGSTSSVEFPAVNPLQITPPRPEDVDAFVTKVAAGGNQFAYSTRLGGSNDDHGLDVAVDLGGNAYVTGDTRSPGFPTARPLQAGAGGTASGVGGSFADAFVSKLDPSGTSLVYSTFLGGSDTDQGTAIAVDGDGAAYVTGSTNSPNFPASSPLQGRKDADTDAFVSKINPAGATLVYSTYLGGGGADGGTGIAVDRSGNATVVGATASSNFPTARPLQGVKGGGVTDAFLSTFGATGTSLATSTYLGGRDDDQAAGVAMAGNTPVLVGSTSSSDFPTANPLQPTRSGTTADAFVTRMSPAGGESTAPTSTAVGSTGTHERRVRILVATTAALFLIAVLQTAYLRRRAAAEARDEETAEAEPVPAMPVAAEPEWGGGVRVLDDEPADVPAGDAAFAPAGALPDDDDGMDTEPPPPGEATHTETPVGPATLAVPDLLEEWAGAGTAAGGGAGTTPPPPRAALEDLSFWDLFPEDLPPSRQDRGIDDDEWAIDDSAEDVLVGPPSAAAEAPGDAPSPPAAAWDDDLLLTDLLAGELGATPPAAQQPDEVDDLEEDGDLEEGGDEWGDFTMPHPDDDDDLGGVLEAGPADDVIDGGDQEETAGDGEDDDADGEEEHAGAGSSGTRTGSSGGARRRPRSRRSGRRKRPTSG